MHRNVVGRCYFGVVFVGLAVYIFLFHMVGLLFQNGEAESVVTIQYLCVVWCFFFFFRIVTHRHFAHNHTKLTAMICIVFIIVV